MAVRQRGLKMMLRQALYVLVLTGLLVSGAAAQILNSERIEQTFGSYGIDVIAADGDLRISNLYSIEDGAKVTRTYAVVATPSRVDQAIASQHAEILGGGSIGATFKEAGWDVVKRNLYFGRARVPPAVAGAMGLAPRSRVAMHAYVLDVTMGNARFEYATIVELHHPDYLQLNELLDIYAPDWHSDQEVPDNVVGMLTRAEQELASMPLALGE